jgi:hypothetical protein
LPLAEQVKLCLLICQAADMHAESPR